MTFRAFVAFVASLMALNALAIDSMLPALGLIGESLHTTHPNDRQWVISAYVLGFGAAQLVHGTLSDRYGRRPLLLGGLVGYILFSTLAAFSGSFLMMILARAATGAAAAAARVVAVSMVRDCYAGRQMARVMSLAFIVFLVVPILAPSVGTLVLLVGRWRWIFGLLAAMGLAVLAYALARLPETLPPSGRREIRPGLILTRWRRTATDRLSIGYTMALALMSAALYGFINSVEQIMAGPFARPAALPLTFAVVGASMAVGSFLNARVVERLGTRRVSHTALIGFTLCAATHYLIARAGLETLASFIVLQAATMFCFSLCTANFGAMAMDNMGDIAGAAASLQGFYSTVGGALVGFAIGQSFDGTTLPMAGGFTIAGLLSLAAVLATERGRLFRPAHPITG